MLLGNMLLALAWAALQGDFSLQTLLTGQILGTSFLLPWSVEACSGHLRMSGGSIGLWDWPGISSGNSSKRTSGWLWTSPRPTIT